MVKTYLKIGHLFILEIGVMYRQDPAVGEWLPYEMTERYDEFKSDGISLDGVARYTNYRRFESGVPAAPPPKDEDSANCLKRWFAQRS